VSAVLVASATRPRYSCMVCCSEPDPLLHAVMHDYHLCSEGTSCLHPTLRSA